MKTRRLLKTKRYVGKGLRAWFFSRQSTIWCDNGNDIEDAIDTYVKRLFSLESDSDVVTVLTAMSQLILKSNKVFRGVTENYTIPANGAAAAAAAPANDAAPSIVLPAQGERLTPLTIVLTERANPNEVIRLKPMLYWMKHLKDSIKNIITKVKNANDFRSSRGVCVRGKQEFILSDAEATNIIIEAILVAISDKRSSTLSGTDLPEELDKYFFTNDFTYAQLKHFIIADRELYPINNSQVTAYQVGANEEANADNNAKRHALGLAYVYV